MYKLDELLSAFTRLSFTQVLFFPYIRDFRECVPVFIELGLSWALLMGGPVKPFDTLYLILGFTYKLGLNSV